MLPRKGSSSNRISFSVQGSGKKRNGGANRDPVWNFFREEIEFNGVVVVRCRECHQHPLKTSILSYHWKAKHSEKEQPSMKLDYLGLTELHGSHQGILLRSKADELLEEYGLTVHDLCKTVTDSGSNTIAAFKDVLSFDPNCDWVEYEQAEEDFSSMDNYDQSEREMELELS
uniref:BED-type domain-containing protein n=1 Tax=Ditylenchus dipsaci TaxID=166011 RepID=A0A915EC77_9BILA